ncbi:helix-turn-helix transcriptional regulator [Hungatella effluvii]|uniref:helix-turn-helix transcriptional regulator n=1 Tax=Hungatella effluvii TaxID=1096246 RepID=UPI002A80D166|nr:helix-turn-helix transcriptional regulator [Hungatella effluvii]
MNKHKLEEEMKRQGISKEKLCSELGISRSAFYRKCKGKTQFTLEEIQAIVKVLKLDSPVDIFFADKVSQKTHLE